MTNLGSIEINSLELRGKRHLGLRHNPDTTAKLLAAVGVVLAATCPVENTDSDTVGAKVRSLHSPKRDSMTQTRVTTDVGAFLPEPC